MSTTTTGIDFRTEQSSSLSAKLGRFLSQRSEARGLILLALVAIVTVIFEPGVFSAWPATLSRIALIGLVALGLTVVILMGELDLSVASTYAMCGVVMASFDNLWLGIAVALVVGIIVGVINAFFVVGVGLNSFIATLGMLFFLRGLGFVLSDEEPVRIANADAAIQFGRSFGKITDTNIPVIGQLNAKMVIFLLTFIAIQIYVTRVRSGRELYAVGGNRQAARDAGIPVTRRIFSGFMICGFVAAGAGVINVLERTAADPTAGGDVLLQSFAAAIIGGIALTGGRGSVLGTLIGAAALGMMQVALTRSGVEPDVQNIIIGGVLLLAVTTDPDTLRSVWGSVRSRRLAATTGGRQTAT